MEKTPLPESSPNQNLKDTYNRIAEDWFHDHHTDTWWEAETNRLISLLPSNASVLDIGCGAGHKAHYLAQKGLKVTGADFSEKMINIARAEVSDASFKVLDIYNLDSLKESYDAVFAQAVLLHIPKKDVLTILEKIKHVLERGGLLYVAVKEAWPNTPEEETLKENDYGYEYERFFSYFTVPELQSHFEKAGLEIIRSTATKVGKTNWIQMIGKKS